MRNEIADVFRHEGPFVTAYVTSRSDIPHAAQELATRWKSVRRALADQGATDAVLGALDASVRGAGHTQGDTLALVAAGDEVLVDWHLPEPPRADVGWVSSLPRIATILEAAQTLLPHLVVLVDRLGADIYGFTASGRPVEREVRGSEEEVTHFTGGGWSQRRYQQRSVNAWEENAHEVADEVARLAKRIDARLLVVGGDVYAVGFLKDALPDEVRALCRDVAGASRHPDGGVDHVAEDVKRLVDTVVAAETTAIVQQFKEERGQGDRAAVGVACVIEALQTATVGTLLVHDEPDDLRTAWFGPEPLHVGIDEATVAGMGVAQPWEARAVDVCIRAALGSSADVRVVPKSVLTDNVGAILRHTGTRPATR